jgi:L-iditol 2-dehydrogenase
LEIACDTPKWWRNLLKALVKYARGEGNLELRDVVEPRCGVDEVLVEVEAAGICGTDVHILHDQTFYTPPVTIGHEYCGRVIRVGREVQGIELGDRVTSPATVPCGECLLCKTNHQNRCVAPDKKILGVSRANGAFAEYMAVPTKIIHKVPQNVTSESAAVAEPIACVVHAVIERAAVKSGESVVIQGPGAMGLIATEIASIQGAKPIIITGIGVDKERLGTAKRLGAHVAVNIEQEDPVKVVNDLTSGLGADVVLEASGSPAARRQSFDLVRRCGRIGYIGLTGRSKEEAGLDNIVDKELSVIGSWGTVWTSWRTTLELMAEGKIVTEPLISHRLPLEDWKNGFDLMESREGLKILLRPHEKGRED